MLQASTHSTFMQNNAKYKQDYYRIYTDLKLLLVLPLQASKLLLSESILEEL